MSDIYCIKRNKTKILFKENPLIFNLKGKSFSFLFKMPDAACLACFELRRNWSIQIRDNRSQQHVQAMYGRFDFIGPTHTSWETSNRKWRNCRKIVVALNDSWNKTSIFSCTRAFLDLRTCIHSTVGIGMHITIWNRLYMYIYSVCTICFYSVYANFYVFSNNIQRIL